jgi:hypothetical protein
MVFLSYRNFRIPSHYQSKSTFYEEGDLGKMEKEAAEI